MDLGTLAGKTLDEVRKQVCNIELTNLNSQQAEGNRDYFPMSGESEVVEVKKNSADNKVEIEINRLFSKINAPTVENPLTIAIRDKELDKVFGGTVEKSSVKFEMESYYVINGLNKSYAFRNYNEKLDENEKWDHDNYWKIPESDGWKYFPTNEDENKVYSGTTGDNTIWLENTPVYVYENSPTPILENGMTLFNKDHIYAMILKGTLTAKVEVETEEGKKK